MKAIFLFLAGLLMTGLTGCNRSKFSVLYGNRNLDDCMEVSGRHSTQVNHVVRLYFDSEGFLYPPHVNIPDSFLVANGYTFAPSAATIDKDSGIPELMERDSARSDFLSTYGGLYRAILKHAWENQNTEDEEKPALIQPEDYQNFKELFDAISIEGYKNELDSVILSNGYDNVTILMVGFNNRLVTPKGKSGSTSVDKLREQRENIDSLLNMYNLDSNRIAGIKKTLFIEVHWDGKFTSKRGIQTALNYKPALRTSYKVGLTLRKFINSLDSSIVQVNMISHSSGANIICESMFNQISKVGRKKESRLWTYLNNKYVRQSRAYRTPDSRKIVVGLLAPSMPGLETFNDYYKRSDKFREDNYRIIVGYNVNDYALRKQFGKGLVGSILNFANSRDQLVKKNVFGSTSLGCLEPEVERLKAKFRKSFELENITFVNLSVNIEKDGSRKPNKIHEVEKYFRTDRYADFISSVYKLKEEPVRLTER